jgi:hypothetical protein
LAFSFNTAFGGGGTIDGVASAGLATSGLVGTIGLGAGPFEVGFSGGAPPPQPRTSPNPSTVAVRNRIACAP